MPELHSRRRFLRQSAAIAAGACTSLGLAGEVIGGAASRLRVGIVGADELTSELPQAVQECGDEVVAHCDAGDRQLAGARFDDPATMIERAPLDAVIVSGSTAGATDIVRRALQRGVHVYTAPVGDSIAEARELGELARQSGVLTQVNLRSAGGDLVEHIVRPLQTGAIGRIREVVCWSNSISGRGFQSLGQLVLSLPLSALELNHPTAINAAGSTPPGAAFPEGLAVRYAFPRPDGDAPLHVTWYDGAWSPPYESVDGIELSACGALYLGESGQLLDDLGTGRATLLLDGRPPHELTPVAAPNLQSLRSWLAACAGRPGPLTGLETSAILNSTILAGLIAYRTQQSLDWDGPAMCARNCPQAGDLMRSSADVISLV